MASRLFRSLGDGESGINQILKESEVARASLYLHFPTKEALGQAYLKTYSEGQFELVAGLMQRNPAPHKIIGAWARILKHEAKSMGLYGCAIANLRAETPGDHTELHQTIRETAARMVTVIREYIEQGQASGQIAAHLDASGAARRVFVAYEGAMQVWLLTGELESLDDFADLARGLLVA